MIKNIYAIRDKLTEYKGPFLEDNDMTAMRAVKAALETEGQNMFIGKPSDYTLNCIGTYDTKIGVIEPCEVRVVCEVDSLIDKEVKKSGKK